MPYPSFLIEVSFESISFNCMQNYCLTTDARCDGALQCGDRTDEQHCSKLRCH